MFILIILKCFSTVVILSVLLIVLGNWRLKENCILMFEEISQTYSLLSTENLFLSFKSSNDEINCLENHHEISQINRKIFENRWKILQI